MCAMAPIKILTVRQTLYYNTEQEIFNTCFKSRGSLSYNLSKMCNFTMRAHSVLGSNMTLNIPNTNRMSIFYSQIA